MILIKCAINYNLYFAEYSLQLLIQFTIITILEAVLDLAQRILAEVETAIFVIQDGHAVIVQNPFVCEWNLAS